jgi:hypothetical protein
MNGFVGAELARTEILNEDGRSPDLRESGRPTPPISCPSVFIRGSMSVMGCGYVALCILRQILMFFRPFRSKNAFLILLSCVATPFAWLSRSLCLERIAIELAFDLRLRLGLCTRLFLLFPVFLIKTPIFKSQRPLWQIRMSFSKILPTGSVC